MEDVPYTVLTFSSFCSRLEKLQFLFPKRKTVVAQVEQGSSKKGRSPVTAGASTCNLKSVLPKSYTFSISQGMEQVPTEVKNSQEPSKEKWYHLCRDKRNVSVDDGTTLQMLWNCCRNPNVSLQEHKQQCLESDAFSKHQDIMPEKESRRSSVNSRPKHSRRSTLKSIERVSSKINVSPSIGKHK